MHKQIRAYYDMASDYHIAAATLWTQIVDAPYLYFPISFLLRHTIELQLKGLIILELREENSSLNINDIKMPSNIPLSKTHSLKLLWDYYKEILLSHYLFVDKKELKSIEKVILKIDKKDFSSTRYRYPVNRKNQLSNIEPIDFKFSNDFPDISQSPPTVIVANGQMGYIKSGQNLLRNTSELFEVVEILFKYYDNVS